MHGSPKSGHAPSFRTESPNLQSQPVKPAAKATRAAPFTPEGSGEVRGNQQGKMYWVAGCKGYASMAPASVIAFATEAEAQQAGYRKAKDCP